MGRTSKGIWMSVAVLLACGTAVAGTIDFNSDSAGYKPNGWSSVDSALVSFTDSVGAGLDVADYGYGQTAGQGLWTHTDYDGSILLMDFAVDMSALSFDFGNDDPGWVASGAYAALALYDGATQVGYVSVVMNRDDIINQSIGYSGACFDHAVFGYYNADGSIAGLMEAIDNMEFTPCDNIVPEPATMSLLGLALAGMASRRYLRRR